jgi:hypothetical protein
MVELLTRVFKIVSADVKVHAWKSVVEMSTTIYLSINVSSVQIDGQIALCYTKAENYYDGWSHWYVRGDTILNSQLDSGWYDP